MTTRYTCEEVAKIYKVKLRTIHSWIRSGKLAAVATGRNYIICEEDLLEFERSSKTTGRGRENVQM